MKTVILCGGLGTRLSEETVMRPKPMVEIANRPVLWHIMKIYAKFNFNDFVLALGYKGEFIKNYFLNYHAASSDLTVELNTGKILHENVRAEDWIVRMVDTGKHSLTGGRLKRLESLLKGQGTFMLTYGDGVSDVNIAELIKFHKSHGKIATMTAVRPPARFGTMQFNGSQVTDFSEKPQTGEGWINGGYFVFEPEVFSYLKQGDNTILEKEPLEMLARDGELMAHHYNGFWKCMDTIRDKNVLNEMCKDSIPWLI